MKLGLHVICKGNCFWHHCELSLFSHCFNFGSIPVRFDVAQGAMLVHFVLVLKGISLDCRLSSLMKNHRNERREMISTSFRQAGTWNAPQIPTKSANCRKFLLTIFMISHESRRGVCSCSMGFLSSPYHISWMPSWIDEPLHWLIHRETISALITNHRIYASMIHSSLAFPEICCRSHAQA